MFDNGQSLDAVLTTILAHQLELPPVWLAIIAPPSTGKTSLLDRLPSQSIPKRGETLKPGSIVALDCLTPRTLLSGLNDVTSTGLLERMTNAIILMRELSTLSTRPEDLRETVGLLRRIYDGQIDAAWGTGKTVSWTGRLTMIMCGVKHPASIDTELGARMLTIKLARSETDNDRLLKRNHVSSQAYISDVLSRHVPSPTDDDLNSVKSYAYALAVLRASVFRDRDGQVTDVPEHEEPHRLVGQLAAFSLCMRVVNPLADIDNVL